MQPLLLNASPDVTGWVNLFLNFGTAGVVLYWFMNVTTPALKDVARGLDRMSRSLVTLTLTLAQFISGHEAIVAQCESLKKELDESEQERDPKK